ncbi:MAG TPA: hydrogenase [Cyanobacteria bacterium UBA9971]|nr:hydrogenase [Cyanobacteria bacterium UBA9971]
MKWIISKNNQVISLNEIPVLGIDELRNEIIKQYKTDKRVVGFFGCAEYSNVRLYTILADDNKSELLISSVRFMAGEKSYPSITKDISAFQMFEREFYEEFGIEPVGHPWLKPVRYSKNRFDKTQKIENYPFFKMDGEEVHEVAVGPIHAGVIEPGHFRFMCNGEKVYHLEIQLGYQHRGTESLFENNNNFAPHLAESIAGDTVIGHAITYSNAVEALLNIKISDKAELIRVLALELERIAVHIGDLGAISNDIGYLMGNSVFGATRTLVINTLLSICGSRFGRGLIRVGGVAFDIDIELSEKISKTLDKVLKDVDKMTETMFSSASVLSRLEKTGTLSMEKAKMIGLVGIATRASGLSLDARADHSWGWYKKFSFDKEILESGDVFARTHIRYKEIKQSMNIIKELLNQIQDCKEDILLVKSKNQLLGNSMVVSMVEGWRGEAVHTALTNNEGQIFRYKIKDPSFNNWYGLALAVRNNGISDFPLCNKSFNLSYCGNDL